MGRGNRKERPATGQSLETLAQSLPDKGELFLVGGAIRDDLLGKQIKDEDLALGGLLPAEAEEWLRSQGPLETLAVAGKTIGWRVRPPWGPPGGIEVALLRREESSGPGHTDFRIDTEAVQITEDLGRRDFSCNAIARDLRSGQIIDPYGGQEDLEQGVLRAIGEHVFREDPLRLLRGAVRVGKDNLWPDPKTLGWMSEADTSHLSPERVWNELHKIILSPSPQKALQMLQAADQYSRILPELADTVGWNQRSRYHSLPCDEHCLRALQYAGDKGYDPAVRWAALLHDSGKPRSAWEGDDGHLHYYENPKAGKRDHSEEGHDIAAALLDRLRAPRQLQEDVCYLVRHHMWQDLRGWQSRTPEAQALRARRFLDRHGDYAWQLVDLRRADASSKGRSAAEDLRELDAFEATLQAENRGRWRREDLQISGDDLLDLGLRGPAVGETLREIHRRIIDNPSLNERERLLGWAKKIAAKRAPAKNAS